MAAEPQLHKPRLDSRFQTIYPDHICRVNGYDSDAFTYIPVVIIGAGESGIAMGCRLKEKLGFDQFRIFDRQGGAGGTWWINRYPGVACDIPAPFYTFSFAPNPEWATFYPSGREIVAYLHDVCSKYGITDKIQCNTNVEGARWLEDANVWEVTLNHMVPGMGDLSVKDRDAKIAAEGAHAVYSVTEKIRCRVLVTGVGGLVEPKAWPSSIPGAEDFKGTLFHSARWKPDVDVRDKDVIVVGTGCSAAQVVPELVKPEWGAKSVTQIMRSPPWVCPKAQPPIPRSTWNRWGPFLQKNVPLFQKLLRFGLFFGAETGLWPVFKTDPLNNRWRRAFEGQLLQHMKSHVPKKYHTLMTPDYSVGCKRIIFDEMWLDSLNHEKIELTTQPLQRLNPTSVTLGPGNTYLGRNAAQNPAVASDAREMPADVIVLANGFETTRWLFPLKINGRGGTDLLEEMDRRGGPQAYLGSAMDGFPNFFMIFGPNTATGHSSVILASENMVEMTLKLIAPLLRGEANSIEVKRSYEEAYTARLQRELKDTVWHSGGCGSWYFDPKTGWNSTVYPRSQWDFMYRTLWPDMNAWTLDYTAKGKTKVALRRVVKLALFAALFVGVYRARQSGLEIREALRALFSRRNWWSVFDQIRFKIAEIITR